MLHVLASLWISTACLLSLHSWYAKCRHCERCAVGIQRSSQPSKQYTQTLCVPTSPPYTRSCLDQTLSSPCPLTGSSHPPPGASVPTVGECGGGIWDTLLVPCTNQSGQMARCSTSSFTLEGRALGNWLSRFTLLNLVLFGRNVGSNTQRDMKRR